MTFFRLPFEPLSLWRKVRAQRIFAVDKIAFKTSYLENTGAGILGISTRVFGLFTL